MTAIAKLLVLLNVFAAGALCSWAVATYVNKIDPAEAVDLAGEKLTAKIKRQSNEARQGQSNFPQGLVDIDKADREYTAMKGRIKQLLDQALTGTFVRNPIPQGRIDLINNPDPGLSPQILGLDGQPLRGRKQLEKELDESVRTAAAASTEIETLTKLQAEIGPRINTEDARAARLKTIFQAQLSEIEYLSDERVNWENRGVSLGRRRNQLQNRLTELEAAVKANTDAPANPAK